jgi:hypothetical protein
MNTDQQEVSLPQLFISATAKQGHEHTVATLFDDVVSFCDVSGAGAILTSPHYLPDSPELVLTINFDSPEQLEEFIHLKEYQDFRIDLIGHCKPGRIAVLK